MNYAKRMAQDAIKNIKKKTYDATVGVPLKIAGVMTGLASIGGNEPGIYDNIRAIWEAPQIAYSAATDFFTVPAAKFLVNGGIDAVSLIANPVDNIANRDLEAIIAAGVLGAVVWNADKPFKFVKYWKGLRKEKQAERAS